MRQQLVFEIQAGLCRGMGNPLRMEILDLLRDRQLSVGELVSSTHRPQSMISQNLAALRNVGLLVAQREGNKILYRIASPKLVRICDLMREMLTEQINEKSRLTGCEASSLNYENEPEQCDVLRT
jgi:DNA-binding transcriptional ArsR family regulator